jgi:signal transduction histidine kinase
MKTEGSVDGQGDPARIKQALSNLLGNAIQYSEEGSPITVTIKGNESNIGLSVHNIGKPIPASAINTIFESLVRGPDGDIEKT